MDLRSESHFPWNNKYNPIMHQDVLIIFDRFLVTLKLILLCHIALNTPGLYKKMNTFPTFFRNPVIRDPFLYLEIMHVILNAK